MNYRLAFKKSKAFENRFGHSRVILTKGAPLKKGSKNKAKLKNKFEK